MNFECVHCMAEKNIGVMDYNFFYNILLNHTRFNVAQYRYRRKGHIIGLSIRKHFCSSAQMTLDDYCQTNYCRTPYASMAVDGHVNM